MLNIHMGKEEWSLDNCLILILVVSKMSAIATSTTNTEFLYSLSRFSKT